MKTCTHPRAAFHADPDPAFLLKPPVLIAAALLRGWMNGCGSQTARPAGKFL
jgi:hypothetical protein